MPFAQTSAGMPLALHRAAEDVHVGGMMVVGKDDHAQALHTKDSDHWPVTNAMG